MDDGVVLSVLSITCEVSPHCPTSMGVAFGA